MIYIRQDRAMGPNITKRIGEKPATECERISGKKEEKKNTAPELKFTYGIFTGVNATEVEWKGPP